jgi:hypothetical protein
VRQVFDVPQGLFRDHRGGPSESFPLCARPLEPGSHAFRDPLALELRDGRQKVHLEPSGGRGGVDPLGQRYEGNAQHLKLVKQPYEMF